MGLILRGPLLLVRLLLKKLESLDSDKKTRKDR
jgi:hypothetical protein